MKRSVFLLLIFAAVLVLSSCSKDDYSIRFKNNFTETINDVAAGSTYIGTVAPGQTSAYQPFTAHSFIISGTSVTGRTLSGTEAVSGKGKHKWTITLSNTGVISMTEDQL